MTIAHTRRFLQVILLAAVVLLTLSLTAAAQQNIVYINGNITATGQNAVIGLVNDGSGNFTPLPGSPFLTGGTGVGANPNPMVDAQWDSDGELAMNKAGTLLFAVNGHSNDISIFKINSDGTLTLTGSPTPSGGPQPASIAWRENALGNGVSMMVVANKDSDSLQTQTNPNYTTFRVNSSGVAIMNSGSTYALPKGASVAQVLYRQKGAQNIFGMEFFSSKVSAYKVTSNGTLSLINSLTTAAPVVGAVFNPNVNGFYVTEPPGAVIGVYGYNSTTGALSFLKTVKDNGMANCWNSVNATGTRLYVAETMSGTISVFDTTNSRTPVQMQHMSVALDGATAPLPTHNRVDPTGKFLYVLDRNATLHVFDIAADGTLAENHTPYNLGLPSGTVPLGMAVLMK